VRIRDVAIYPLNLTSGSVLRIEVTVDNIGDVTLLSQDDPPPGYTYFEGTSAPVGWSGHFRVGADLAARALGEAHRYRWGLGGNLVPGASRRIVGLIRLHTPGSYQYCVGLVEEWTRWWARCEGTTTIVVHAPTATRTSTAAVTPTRTPSKTPTDAITATMTPTATRTPTKTPTICADSYEPDNVLFDPDNPTRAKVIGANTSIPQLHSFHALGDVDWVKFAVVANITYTLRTHHLQGGNDTYLTIYRWDGDPAHAPVPLAHNDEDPANGSVWPPLIGPSRIDILFTPLQVLMWGNTFYARVRPADPMIFGCNKTYQLSLTRPVSEAPEQDYVAEAPDPWTASLGATAADVKVGTDSARGRLVAALVTDFAYPHTRLPVVLSTVAPQRLDFTITLEVQGGSR